MLPEHQIVLVSYPGILDILIIWLFAFIRKKPVVWDVFISVYDTVVIDRKLISENGICAKLLWIYERLSLKVANDIFMDTKAHADYIERLFSLKEGTCGSIWVGVEEELFPTVISNNRKENLRVLFYGQFIPLHGIEKIIDAACLMKDDNIEFVLIGRGQKAHNISDLIIKNKLRNILWIDWVEYPDLIKWIESADLCLGIFGDSEKAKSVIPNKIYQILSAGKPIITRDSTGVRELLRDAPPCSRLITSVSGKALANAIHEYDIWVKKEIVTQKCHIHLKNKINADAIGRQFQLYLETKGYSLES